MTMKISWHAKERPKAADDPIIKSICGVFKSSSVDSLEELLRQIMVATDETVASVHTMMLTPKEML
jgi:hypothetical protein